MALFDHLALTSLGDFDNPPVTEDSLVGLAITPGADVCQSVRVKKTAGTSIGPPNSKDYSWMAPVHLKHSAG